MHEGPGLDGAGDVLAAAEAASPVEAVEAVTRQLARAIGATSVSFLVADMSGRALVRLAHVRQGPASGSVGTDPAPGERRAAEESATVMPFDAGPAEQAVRTQRVQVLAPGVPTGRWQVLAPVTERGEIIGLLELFVPEEPDREMIEEIARLAHSLAFVVIANRRHTDLYEWGQRTRPLSLWRSSTSCSRDPRRARPEPSRSPVGWSRQPASRGTRSTSAWRGTCCIFR